MWIFQISHHLQLFFYLFMRRSSSCSILSSVPYQSMPDDSSSPPPLPRSPLARALRSKRKESWVDRKSPLPLAVLPPTYPALVVQKTLAFPFDQQWLPCWCLQFVHWEMQGLFVILMTFGKGWIIWNTFPPLLHTLTTCATDQQPARPNQAWYLCPWYIQQRWACCVGRAEPWWRCGRLRQWWDLRDLEPSECPEHASCDRIGWSSNKKEGWCVCVDRIG